jgi:hypothetical protein
VVLGFFKEACFFMLATRSVCYQQSENKEDHRMEMRWGLIALKPLCCFLMFGMCVLLPDARCRMTMWQGGCQLKCARWKSRNGTAERCPVVQISSVVFGF